MSKSLKNSNKKFQKQQTSSSTKKKQSSTTRNKLIEFLKKTAELERKLQIIKQMLAEQQQFTPASLFHRIDTSRKGFIIEKDIQQFVKSNNIKCKGSDIKMLFGNINTNKNKDSVYLREFQNFILPNQNPRLRYFTVRRPVFVPLPSENLSQKIQWITSKFFTQIITQYTSLKEYNHSLISSFDFDINQIFDILSSNKQYITGEDIENFLTDNHVELNKEQVGCILRKMDSQGQGHIYMEDFKQYLATLGLKKQHQIFDELSPIPALKEGQNNEIKQLIKDRDATLKQRYKDNKSYVKGMDVEGHHILGYSRNMESKEPQWLSRSRNRK